jgi:hypothetical protein
VSFFFPNESPSGGSLKPAPSVQSESIPCFVEKQTTTQHLATFVCFVEASHRLLKTQNSFRVCFTRNQCNRAELAKSVRVGVHLSPICLDFDTVFAVPQPFLLPWIVQILEGPMIKIVSHVSMT